MGNATRFWRETDGFVATEDVEDWCNGAGRLTGVTARAPRWASSGMSLRWPISERAARPTRPLATPAQIHQTRFTRREAA